MPQYHRLIIEVREIWEKQRDRGMVSVRLRCLAFDERAGQNVRRLGSGFGFEGKSPTLSGTRVACVQGFSLHANPPVAAHSQDQLERLIRYSAWGAVSLECLVRCR
jgi:Putative transposase